MPTVRIRRHCGAGWPSITDLQEIARSFRLDSDFASAERFGSGHINDTYLVNARQGPGTNRFVLQRINRAVFRDPATLMENIRRVTDHLNSRMPEGHTCLALVPTVAGPDFYVDDAGECWRMYRYLEGARSYDSIPSLAHAREAAAEFGRFQAMLSDLPQPRLNEIIPDFHNTPARFARFHETCELDEYGRASQCRREIDRALQFEECAGSLVSLYEAGEIPERITHNDTKINNVMFDLDTDKAVCVVDLDTVMPGLAPYDFGDLVRTATTCAAEDEKDLSKITMRMDYYEALVDGYLGTSAKFLNDAEVEHLALAGKIITIEIGLRFLSDYLSGDTYFRIDRPDQNLDRCRAQFALASSIDEQLDQMQRLMLDKFRERR